MWNVTFKAVTGVKSEKKKKKDDCKIWMRIRLVRQSITQTVTGNFGLSKNRISTV